MNIEQILNKASDLRILVDHGNLERAWIKAAYLFVEHYVFPSVDESLSVECFQFVENVMNCLLEKLMLHCYKKDCNGKLLQQNVTSSDNCLPTQKCFISMKRLAQKYCKAPCHSHITLSAYGKVSLTSACDYSKWTTIPGLIVGILKQCETSNQLMIMDKSGAIPFHCCEMKPEFLNTVSLIRSWNYIPGADQSEGYIEALDQPIVLEFLHERFSCDDKLVNDNEVNLDKLLQAFHNGLMIKEPFTIQGYILSIIRGNGLPWVIYLSSEPWSEQCYLSNEKCSQKHKLVKNVCIVSNCHRSWMPCLYTDCLVKITNLKMDDNNCELLTTVSTADSRLLIFHELHHVLNSLQVKQDSIAYFYKEDLGDHKESTYCFYVGKIFQLLSPKLEVISLNEGKVLVFLAKSMRSLLGFREGAVIVVRNFHACNVDGRTALVCCDYSTLEVLQHSTRVSFRFNMEVVDWSCDHFLTKLHPSRIFSLISVCDYLFPFISTNNKEDVLSASWVCKSLLKEKPVNSGVNISTKFSDTCIAAQSLVKSSIPFQWVSMQMLKDVAIKKSKPPFATSSTAGTWKAAIFHCRDFLPEDHEDFDWGDNVVLIGLIQSGTSGCIRLSDGKSSLKCVFVSCDLNHGKTLFNDKDNKEFWRKCSPSGLDYVGCLIRVRKFWMVVERQAVNFLEDSLTFKGSTFNKSSQYRYIVYFVINISDIVILKPYMKNFGRCAGNQEVKQISESSHCMVPSTSCDASKKYSHLLLIIQKGPLLSFPGPRFGFSVTVLKQSGDVNYTESHLQFRGRLSAWYSILYPTMLLEIELDDEESYKTFETCPNFFIEGCKLHHIQKFTNAYNFTENEVESFYNFAFKVWKKNYSSSGIDKVYSTSELYYYPCSLRQLVAVTGKITERIECRNYSLHKMQHLYVRLTLASKNNIRIYVRVQLRENCHFNLLGLVSGADVTFYKVKCSIAPQGDVYCKYVPTSFHIVHAINFSNSEIINGDTTQADLFGSLPAELKSPCLLHNLCKNESKDDECNAVLIQAYILRILNAQLSINGDSIERKQNLTFQQDRKKHDTSFDGYFQQSDSVSFHAKCLITDGSARAVLHFSTSTQQHFCNLAGIEPEEWNDVIRLMKQSCSKYISYDCDLQDGKELLLSIEETESDRFARMTTACLFNDINSRLLPSKKVIIRRRVFTRNKPWQCDQLIDREMMCGWEDGSAYKLGTVPIEAQGNTSLRSISLRLLQLNCLFVV